jgi:uncharacterized membrane protein YcaP (DUF421 family)
MNFSLVTIKIILGLVTLFAVTKILGKTQISQITPFDFISSLVIGEIFVHSVFENEVTPLQMIYPIVLWGLLIFIFELIAEKFLKLRGFLEGNPAIIVRDGKIDRNQMKRNKINLGQLLQLLRQNNVFSINEVKFAILEMNGTLSVLKNSPVAAPSRKDFNLPDRPVYLPVTIISDGNVIMDNLKDAGFDLTWLNEQLKIQGINSIMDVFYAEWRVDQGLSVSLK